jgi:hypothetical protein
MSHRGPIDQEVQVIDVISTRALRRLAEVQGEYCVSMYLPTHLAGDDTSQDPIRLKNLTAHAADELRSVDEPTRDVDAMLSAVTALQEDREFWAHQGRGLAVFVTGDRTLTYRLPDPVDKLVVVADRVHIKPLLPFVASGEVFYVLALSQNEVRLLRGSRYSINELALDEIPESLAQALRFDDRTPQLQSHGALRTGTGQVTATFHGHGLGKDSRDADLDRFLSAVDAGVLEIVGDTGAPLVLAGVERVVARYRKLTHHRQVVDGEITGNPERISADDLHDRSWPLVKPLFDAAKDDARERILGRSERTGTTVADVVIAAGDGRVQSLFVPLGVQRWGRFDAEQREVEEHDERRPGDRDLLDVATLETMLTGGSVYAVAPEDVPGDELLAAEFRY